MPNRWSPGCRCCRNDPGQLIPGSCLYRVPSSWTADPEDGTDAGEVEIVVSHLTHFGYGTFDGTYIVMMKGGFATSLTGLIDSPSSGGKYMRLTVDIWPHFADGPRGSNTGCRITANTAVYSVGTTTGAWTAQEFESPITGETFDPDLRTQRLIGASPRSSPLYPASWTDPRGVLFRALP